jgi:hypothetical protein
VKSGFSFGAPAADTPVKPTGFNFSTPTTGFNFANPTPAVWRVSVTKVIV